MNTIVNFKCKKADSESKTTTSQTSQRLCWMPLSYDAFVSNLFDSVPIILWIIVCFIMIHSLTNTLIDWQLISDCVLQSSELSLVKFWQWCFLTIKSGFLFMWSAQPPILTMATIMLDDYFKTNPGIKDLLWPLIEPQTPSPQPVVTAMRTTSIKIYFGTQS